jgi:DNA helicase II / ATP-dependent DNA helicase PcrA
VPIEDSFDQLIKLAPDELAAQYDDLVDALEETLEFQRVTSGPVLPRVSTDLDDHQRKLIDSSAQTIRLLAPAGSGKTHCIVNKVLALVNAGGSAARIVLLTFDNASRTELQDRVVTIFGPTNAPRVTTLNSYGNSLVRQFQYANKSPPRLINSAGSYQFKLIQQLLRDLNTKNPHLKSVLPDGIKSTFYLDLISLFKNQLFSVRLIRTPEEGVRKLWNILSPLRATSAAPLFAKIGDDRGRTLSLLASLDWLYRSYEREKEAQGFIDFDDQKLFAYELLLENESIRATVQGAIDTLIVDEFQDLNELDFKLILLAGSKANLIVVGDDDQAIYGFRGTSPRYIIEFESLSGRQLESLPLSFNYRCPANIVAHSANLIRHNTYRVEKHPKAAREENCDIQVYNALTPSAEAAAIGRYIEKVRDAGHSLREIAILYRMNAQSLPLQLDLLTRGIPYYCRKEDNLIEQEHLPRVIAMLRYAAAVQRQRDPALEDFLGAVRGYFKYMNPEDDRLIRRAATDVGPPFIDAFSSSILAQSKIAKSGVSGALHELLTSKSPLEAITTISRRFPGIRGLVGTLEDAVSGEVPLGELGDVAVRFRKLDSFAEFLEKALLRARSTETPDMESDSVRLLTYFRSKGTQFDTVILPTVNAGVIPHARAQIEDERRLFYVAVTRTKKNLWLSYVKRSCNQKVEASPFLRELALPATVWAEPAKRGQKRSASI